MPDKHKSRALWPSRPLTIGKEVRLEESGEKIGNVVEEVLSSDNTIVGYKVLDSESGSTIYFPSEQVTVTKRGLLVEPLWYTEAMKVIRRLELQENMIPDIVEMSRNLSGDELYKMLSNIDPKLVDLTKEGLSVREGILKKYENFQEEARRIRAEIIDKTGAHLLEGGKKRKDFSREILVLRKKAKIIEANINKCNELLLRLNTSPFLSGMVSQHKYPLYGVSTGGSTDNIVCPYRETCPIIHGKTVPSEGDETKEKSSILAPQAQIAAPEATSPKIRPFRIVKMEEMRKKLEEEAKKIEEELKKKISGETSEKVSEKKKTEETAKPAKPKKKGLRARVSEK